MSTRRRELSLLNFFSVQFYESLSERNVETLQAKRRLAG
jgi:hypothetical protein